MRFAPDPPTLQNQRNPQNNLQILIGRVNGEAEKTDPHNQPEPTDHMSAPSQKDLTTI